MDTSLLLNCFLFRSLPAGEIEKMLTAIRVRETIFKKGDILAEQGESCNRLIILLTGSVKAEMTDPSGKVTKVEDIYAPDPLAILFLFGNQNRFPVQVTAIEEVKTLVIPKESVLKILQWNRVVLKNYLDTSSDFAARLSKKLHFMSFHTIRQKIALYLLELSGKKQQDTVRMDKTKTALAEYFGVSRPALEREFTKMQQEDLIRIYKKEITICDKNELIRLTRF